MTKEEARIIFDARAMMHSHNYNEVGEDALSRVTSPDAKEEIHKMMVRCYHLEEASSGMI